MGTSDTFEYIQPPDSPPPDTQNPDEMAQYINIRVEIHDQFRRTKWRQFNFRIKMTTIFEYLMARVEELYDEMIPLSRYLYIGELLFPSETPEDKSMENGDSISVVHPWPRVKIHEAIKLWPPIMLKQIFKTYKDFIEYQESSTTKAPIVPSSKLKIIATIRMKLVEYNELEKSEIVEIPESNEIASEPTDVTEGDMEAVSESERSPIVMKPSSKPKIIATNRIKLVKDNELEKSEIVEFPESNEIASEPTDVTEGDMEAVSESERSPIVMKPSSKPKIIATKRMKLVKDNELEKSEIVEFPESNEIASEPTDVTEGDMEAVSESERSPIVMKPSSKPKIIATKRMKLVKDNELEKSEIVEFPESNEIASEPTDVTEGDMEAVSESERSPIVMKPSSKPKIIATKRMKLVKDNELEKSEIVEFPESNEIASEPTDVTEGDMEAVSESERSPIVMKPSSKPKIIATNRMKLVKDNELEKSEIVEFPESNEIASEPTDVTEGDMEAVSESERSPIVMKPSSKPKIIATKRMKLVKDNELEKSEIVEFPESNEIASEPTDVTEGDMEAVSESENVEVIEVFPEDFPEDVEQPPLSPITVDDKNDHDPILDMLFMLKKRLILDKNMMITLLSNTYCNWQLTINQLIDDKIKSMKLLAQMPCTQTQEPQPQPQDNQRAQEPMSTAFTPSTNQRQPTTSYPALTKSSFPFVSKRKIPENDISEGHEDQTQQLQQPPKKYQSIRVPVLSIISTNKQQTAGNSVVSENCSSIPSIFKDKTPIHNVAKDYEDQTQQFQQQSQDLQCVRPSAALTASTSKRLPIVGNYVLIKPLNQSAIQIKTSGDHENQTQELEELPRKKQWVQQPTPHTVSTNKPSPNAGNFAVLKRPTQSTSATQTSGDHENQTQELEELPRKKQWIQQPTPHTVSTNKPSPNAGNFAVLKRPTQSTSATQTSGDHENQTQELEELPRKKQWVQQPTPHTVSTNKPSPNAGNFAVLKRPTQSISATQTSGDHENQTQELEELPRKKQCVQKPTPHTVSTNKPSPNAGNFAVLKRPTQSTSATKTSGDHENQTQKLCQKQPRKKRRVQQSKMYMASNSKQQPTTSNYYSSTRPTMCASKAKTLRCRVDSKKTESSYNMLDIIRNI